MAKALLLCTLAADELTLFNHAFMTHRGFDWHALLVFEEKHELFPELDFTSRWGQSCEDLGIRPEALHISAFSPRADLTSRELGSRLAFPVSGYDRVYIPDIRDDCRLRRVVASAAAHVLDTCWMESRAGSGTEVCALDDDQMSDLMRGLNTHYAELFVVDRIRESDCRGVRQYRRISGSNLCRYTSQISATDVSEVSDPNPWDFLTSSYERQRQELELATISTLDWASLLEVGACQGTFTERLLRTFPDRNITACEPNHHFFRGLQSKNLGGVHILREPIASIQGQFDIVLASNILYYLEEFPAVICGLARRYIVLSNPHDYQVGVAAPWLRNHGWRLINSRVLLPEMEFFAEIPVIKAGTEVTVWCRSMV